jgi:hypothetical protein
MESGLMQNDCLTAETKEHIRFPSIEQYRHAIKKLREFYSYDGKTEDGTPIYRDITFSPVRFWGVVKAHGTNAAIVQKYRGADLQYQSRERVITPENDNAGFATYMQNNYHDLLGLMYRLRERSFALDDESVAIFGEWCGGNIQAGVALNQLPKMFIVFAIRFGRGDKSPYWMLPHHHLFDASLSKCVQTRSINEFGHYILDVDLNQPEFMQNMIKKWVEEVEAECPIGKYFGKSGIGEGLVFYADVPGLGLDYAFKAKGEKHANTKVKTIAAVDIEKVTALNELVDKIVTENRLTQMIDVLRDKEGLKVEVRNIGTYLKIVFQDCLKEESDLILGNGVTTKEFCHAAHRKIKAFYFNLCQ